jgi:excinuclease UvrABC ATPase subunit
VELAQAAAAGRAVRQRRRSAITFTYFTEAGGRTQRKHRFEGIIPNLERRYRETDRRRCAKNCPSTSASSRARNATARA